jgi:hypothetical protein
MGSGLFVPLLWHVCGTPSAYGTASSAHRRPCPRTDSTVRTPLVRLPQLEGEVDWLSRDFLGVRTDDGIYRFMHISVFGGPTGVGHHIFVDDLDQAETERAWASWLEGLFSEGEGG